MKNLLKHIFMKKPTQPEATPESLDPEEIHFETEAPEALDPEATPEADPEATPEAAPEAAPSDSYDPSDNFDSPADPLSHLDLTDPAIVTAIRQALNFDTELEAARAAGELAGRNARIEQLLSSPEPNGDGLPFHGSGCVSTPLEPQSIFHLASQAR